MFSIPWASPILLQLQYIANFATSKLQPRSLDRQKPFYGNAFCICIFFLKPNASFRCREILAGFDVDESYK